MYVLMSGKINGAITVTGPFPTEKRALEYAVAMDKGEPNTYRHHTKPIIVPFAVVKTVVWRSETARG
jgi:hypothetical protein